MAKRNDIDKAIRNIMNWASRPEWSGEQTAIFNDHLAPVCQQFNITQQELGQDLEEHDVGGMLFGLMFEDFLSRRLLPNDKNIIDDYLARRAWRESVAGRRYLQQLRDSVLSIYEVVAVSPGLYCDLSDLVRGGRTIRVHEHMGTQNMVKWDRIAARVLNTHGKHSFSGGILPFPREASQNLLKLLTKSRKIFNKERSRVDDERSEAGTSSPSSSDILFLQDACPAFTFVWLTHTLEQIHALFPEMVNRDGEALIFSETRFPFLEQNLDEIIERLDTAPEWERDGPDTAAWTWFAKSDPAVKKSKGLEFDSLRHAQRPIIGTLELSPGVILLVTNSLQRSRRGSEELQLLLRNLIGPPLSSLQTPEQMMAEQTRKHRDGKPAPSDTIDPTIAVEITQNMLDQHYRQSLDHPIPALGNKTPRQCARSKKGREKVVEWLKHLENNELRRAAAQGQPPYNSSWMWDELKVDKYRNC